MKPVAIFLILLLLLSPSASPLEYQEIEIYDIVQERVIHTLPSNPAIQEESEGLLKAITGVYCKFDPIPNRGQMIRIPLTPSVPVHNEWFKTRVNELIVVFPENGEPYLLLFDENKQPSFFTFESSTDKLLDYTDNTLTP